MVLVRMVESNWAAMSIMLEQIGCCVYDDRRKCEVVREEIEVL